MRDRFVLGSAPGEQCAISDLETREIVLLLDAIENGYCDWSSWCGDCSQDDFAERLRIELTARSLS